MGRAISYLRAVNEALRLEMRRDADVILIGEDVAGGGGRVAQGICDAWGGVYGATQGLLTEFGEARVRDTPISEMAFMGAGVGAAATGLRPVVELMHADFIGVCFDQVLNQAAKLRYMSGGKARIPLTIRTTIGGGFRAATQHSQVLYSIFAHIPGLKCVAPYRPIDAKGLLQQAIREDDVVVVFENKVLYSEQGEVPEESCPVPLGQAVCLRAGQDVTLVAISRMVKVALQAAEALAAEGVAAEVLDLRSVFPLDSEAVIESITRTHRLVVVDEDTPFCGLAAEVMARVAERALGELDAPMRRVTPPHTPVPFAPVLEDAYLPSAERVVAAARETLGGF